MRLLHLALLVVNVHVFAQTQNLREDALAAKSGLAKQALLEGRYQEAVSLYRELVKSLPDNLGLRLNLALALDKAGQPSAAIPEAKRVTRGNPSSAPAWLLLGLAYQQLNQPANALAPLRESLRLDPANATTLLELADAELTTGDAQAAAGDFRKLADAQPRFAKAWEGLGRSHLAMSESAFRQIERNAPDSPYFRALLARSAAAGEHFSEALSLYASVLAAVPSFPGMHAARAGIYRRMDMTELAASEVKQESSAAAPDCSRAPAACAGLAGDWQGALAAARGSASAENLYWTAIAASNLAEESFRQLALLPASPEIHAVLADAYQRLGRRLDAIAEWRKSVALAPSDRLFQARLAESLIAARIYPEAETLLTALVSQQPENGEWQYQLGNLLLQLKRADEALPHLVAATKRLPELLPAQEAIGRVYLDLARPAEAVVHLERARSLDDGSISFALSSAYRQLGRPDEARAALTRYQAITRQRAAASAK